MDPGEGSSADGAEFVELDVGSGESIWIRARQLGLESQVGQPTDVGFAGKSFSVVAKALRGIARDVRDALKDAQPEVAEVEFALQVALHGAQVVCLLVDGGATATMRVRMEWRKDEREPEATV